jgi:hypothetical protein
MPGVEPSDAAELAAIRDAPGAPEATVVIKGQLQVVKVYYLSGGPPP